MTRPHHQLPSRQRSIAINLRSPSSLRSSSRFQCSKIREVGAIIRLCFFPSVLRNYVQGLPKKRCTFAAEKKKQPAWYTKSPRISLLHLHRDVRRIVQFYRKSKARRSVSRRRRMFNRWSTERYLSPGVTRYACWGQACESLVSLESTSIEASKGPLLNNSNQL